MSLAPPHAARSCRWLQGLQSVRINWEKSTRRSRGAFGSKRKPRVPSDSRAFSQRVHFRLRLLWASSLASCCWIWEEQGSVQGPARAVFEEIVDQQQTWIAPFVAWVEPSLGPAHKIMAVQALEGIAPA